MDIPVPFMEVGEKNDVVKRIHALCVQGRRAYQADLKEVEKKAILASLQKGKKAVDAYYKERGARTCGEKIMKGLDARLSRVDTNIIAQKLETARLQTLNDSRNARLRVTQANTERYHHSARATALEQRKITADNSKLEFEAKSSKNEWSGLLSKTDELSHRFNNLLSSSLKMQNRNREAEVIDSLQKKRNDLEEEKALLTEREKFCQKQVDSGKGRNFAKYVRGVGKFILKEKINFERCCHQDNKKKRLLAKQAEKRALAASGQIDPMDASFADFDETMPLSANSSQRTGSQMERISSQIEQTNALKKNGPFAVPTAVSRPTAPKPATDAMETDDSALSSASYPRSSSPSSFSSTDHSAITPAFAKTSVTAEVPSARPVPSPQKRIQPVVATPVVIELPRPPPSPVREPTPEEPVEEEVVDGPIEEEMENEAGVVAPEEQEGMDIGVGGEGDSEINQNNSFQFRMSPTGDNGMANFFDASQIQDNNVGTNAVLNISMNSNDPGGDFLAMMQGNSDKNSDGGGAENDFSFGGMFGGSGNDTGGGGNDFPFDFNAGSSSPGDQNASFGFNFGVGDSTSNNEGGDNGGFFFPF